MANASTGALPGKLRSPLGVFLLSIITLGIYYLYWYYVVNRELDEFSPNIDISPGLSLLSQFVPIVGLVSIVRTGGRIGQAQAEAMGEDDCSGIIGLLLFFLFGLMPIYYQAKLNALWESQGQTRD